MSMIMAVVRIVPSNAAFIIPQFKVLKYAAITTAIQTPIDAASVGVAIPP